MTSYFFDAPLRGLRQPTPRRRHSLPFRHAVSTASTVLD
jgi:hypothetical protein